MGVPELPHAGERPRSEGSAAGAWAAAAIVLAVGALAFGVTAHLRANDLQHRVTELESAARDGSATTAPAVVPTSTTLLAPVTTAPGPVEAEAARSDVIAAFTAVYGGAGGMEGRLTRIDDRTGVQRAIEALTRGPNAAYATAAVNVNDVRFTSDTRATVIYGVSVGGQQTVVGREGEARVAGGSWKVTRATICADLAALGVPCGGSG